MLSWQRLINSEFGGLEPKTKTSLHLKMMNRLSIVWFHFHRESHSSAEEGARMRSIVIKRLLLFPFISMLLCRAYKGKNAFCKSSCWVLHNRNIHGFINDMPIWCTSFRPNCHRHHNNMGFQNNYSLFARQKRVGSSTSQEISKINLHTSRRLHCSIETWDKRSQSLAEAWVQAQSKIVQTFYSSDHASQLANINFQFIMLRAQNNNNRHLSDWPSFVGNQRRKSWWNWSRWNCITNW